MPLVILLISFPESGVAVDALVASTEEPASSALSDFRTGLDKLLDGAVDLVAAKPFPLASFLGALDAAGFAFFVFVVVDLALSLLVVVGLDFGMKSGPVDVRTLRDVSGRSV